MTESELRNDPAFNYQWYHTIELLPGIWTPGCSFDNLVATRSMLDLVEVRGRDCLDIGAMEGLVTYLLERRDAARVVAYDRSLSPRETVSNGVRFRLAHRVLNSNAEFVYDVPFRDLHRDTEALGLPQFDVVMFSGVLYHMFDPFAALAQVRNLTRTGGVAVIETAAILSPEFGMSFNVGGRFYSSDDYWFVSAGALEYLLRFLHFQPVDCCYLRHRMSDGMDVIRVGVLCRALPGYLATADDQWMRKQDDRMFAMDFDEFFRPGALSGNNLGRWTNIRASGRSLVWRDATSGILDLYHSLISQDPLSAQQHPEFVRLGLGDR